MKPITAAADTALDERNRATEIAAIGRGFGIPADAVEDAIARGTPLDDFRSSVMQAMGRGHAAPTRSRMALPAIASAEEKPYSLSRAIEAEITGDWRKAGFEREIGQELHRITGRAPNGIYVPAMALAGRAVITTATAPALIGTTHMAEAFSMP